MIFFFYFFIWIFWSNNNLISEIDFYRIYIKKYYIQNYKESLISIFLKFVIGSIYPIIPFDLNILMLEK